MLKGKLAMTSIVHREISCTAKRGFVVLSDQYINLPTGGCSRFRTSKPDLVIYRPGHHHAFIIIATGDDVTEIENKDEEGALPASVLECKVGANSAKAAIPQLYVYIEQLTTDLLEQHLRLESANKIIHKIEIVGATACFEDKSCEVLKIQFDFDKQKTTVFECQEQLSLDDTIQRLKNAF